MKRLIPIMAALAVAACDPGTEPDDLRLDDLPDPPRDVAVVAVTEDLTYVGDLTMRAGQQYFFELRTPPPLPELLYDAVINSTAPAVRIILENTSQTGTFTTGDAGASFLFAAPDGSAFEPQSSCRINVTSALNDAGAGRLRGNVDCPATDGTTRLRVLVKFDHTPG